jgi:hypothetical protein
MKKEEAYDLFMVVLFLLGGFLLFSNQNTFGFIVWIVVLLGVLFKRQLL